ncbi:MAG: hypothetical protein ACRCXB_25365, partial [Aeromonadaceae bacterium]
MSSFVRPKASYESNHVTAPENRHRARRSGNPLPHRCHDQAVCAAALRPVQASVSHVIKLGGT